MCCGGGGWGGGLHERCIVVTVQFRGVEFRQTVGNWAHDIGVFELNQKPAKKINGVKLYHTRE